MEQKKQKLPAGKLVLFALGQFGWSLASWSVSNALTFFFMPPEASGQAPMFPTFIFQGAVFGIMTVIGLINMGGRLWDAVTDPLIANMSDRSTSKLGRRRLFLLVSAVPTALFAFLVFFPIANGSSPTGLVINSLWLVFTITAYYFFITMYCTPYNALISELGHSPDERLGISTAISVTWALGFAIGNQMYALIPVFRNSFGLDGTQAFQAVNGMFQLVAGILMLLPALFIDEKKYAETHATNEGVLESVISTFKNKNFRNFLFSDLPYWIALNFIQMGIAYYIITLLGLDEGLPSFLMLVMFLLSFIFYVPVNFLARKFGKKPVLSVAFVLFGMTFVVTFFFGMLPVPPVVQAWAVVLFASLPMAIFGILPNAIIADVAESHGIETGDYKAGIFYGARTFTMKVGIAVANLLFPSFLLLGKSVENPMGLRLSALAAIVFCAIGFLCFQLYNEKHVLKILATRESLSKEELAEIKGAE